MLNGTVELLFESSRPGRVAYSLPACDVPFAGVDAALPGVALREEAPNLPELSELDVVRHYTRLSQLNHGVDAGFYPLGSCTMKYNPKLNEDMAALPGFTNLHPLVPDALAQGSLRLMYELEQALCEILGMDAVTMMPAAGAHGEMTGLMMIKAYHASRGDHKRKKIVVPDAAHGTNPASAVMAGFEILEIKSNPRGGVDLAALQAAMSDEIAGLMLTNPNTLGLFDENIAAICQTVHEAGGLLYYDGANANAIMGVSRPGDMGFDVVHLNLLKTMSTPHGGGGPGAGPVGVKAFLAPFLPKPVVQKQGESYRLDHDRPLSIGQVRAFYGNFLVLVKAFAYIRSQGGEGLKDASMEAVLNANYLKEGLKPYYDLPYDCLCMHECVFSGRRQKAESGVTTLDIAKRLLDFGYHPPTVYFPLIVDEALMFEPTESESKETLDAFIAVMAQIAREAKETPELVKSAPHQTPIGRLNETQAARNPVLRYQG